LEMSAIGKFGVIAVAAQEERDIMTYIEMY
jgi:hypothetical protein